MNAKKILFPTDLSTVSNTALPYAVSLARDSGGTLLIVHVQDPPIAYGDGEMYFGLLEPDLSALRIMLTAVVPSDPSVPYEHHLLVGNPADEIVRLADSEHVDMIVMATHGRKGLKHLVMGSVAEAVVRAAKCPVLTFKPQRASTAPQHAAMPQHLAAGK